MRPKLKTRASRRIYAVTFALMLAIPATAVALTVAHNDTQSAIQAKLNHHHVSYGQPVTISGNALFGARFQNASTQNPNGTPSYTGSTDMKPTTPLIKHIKLVEDFERVLLWGTGLDHLACPKVSELAGPFRVVLDFPTPP